MADKNIDKLFKSKLDAHGRTPRPEAWNKLSAVLGDEKKGTRKIPLMWIMSVAAALFLILSVGSYWLQNPNALQGGGTDLANGDEDTLKGIKKQRLQELPLSEEENIVPQMAQEENLESQEEQEKAYLRLNEEHSAPIKKDKNQVINNKETKPQKDNKKPSQQKEQLEELDEVAPLSPKKEDKSVLANNTTTTQKNEEDNEVFRVVVRVSLGKESKQNTQVANNKNTKKSKNKLNKVLNTLIDFKEGNNRSDSLGVREEHLWASIGRK